MNDKSQCAWLIFRSFGESGKRYTSILLLALQLKMLLYQRFKRTALKRRPITTKRKEMKEGRRRKKGKRPVILRLQCGHQGDTPEGGVWNNTGTLIMYMILSDKIR